MPAVKLIRTLIPIYSQRPIAIPDLKGEIHFFQAPTLTFDSDQASQAVPIPHRGDVCSLKHRP